MPLRQCIEPKCPGTTRAGTRCKIHELERRRKRQRGQDARRGKTAARGYGAKWRRTKNAYLEAQGHQCEQCDARATAAHHKSPIREGGDSDDGNLEALCHSCHGRITAAEKRVDRLLGPGRPSSPESWIETIILNGPPGAGKSRHVEKRRRRGDIVVDMDRLYVALSHLKERDKPNELLPFVVAARDAVIRRIAAGSQNVRRAWILSSSSDSPMVAALGRRLRAKVVYLDVDGKTCGGRMLKQGRDPSHVNEMMAKAEEWHGRKRGNNERKKDNGPM